MTDVNGDYSLSIKPREAAIIIREVPQAGWTQSYPAAPGYYSVVFTSGMVDPGNNFGNWRYATKSGMKFEDMDADGVADAGELSDHGLSGWTIFADLNGNGTLDAGEPSDVTDVNGDYSLSIKPREAAIIIREVPKAGWTQSYPAAPGYYSVVFTSGMVDPGNNFGNWRYATKSGMKFEDMDADGVADAGELSDHGLSGWTIFADLNGNGTLDAGEPSDVTDVNGDYSLSIKPREAAIIIREVPQAGWTQSYPAAPGYYSVVFTSGMVDPGNNFGNWRYATKSGMKFEDMDADGVADSGELSDHGLSGWTIFADLNGNGTLDAGEPSDVTDVNGDYSLSIKPREAAIIIREVPKAGWTQSYPAAPGYYSVVFTSGMVDPGNNFGNWRYATKSGMKFEDMDADGVADAGELADHGLSGWTIFADLNGNGTLDAGEPSDVTDVNGDYSLSIKPREAAIIIREVPQAGWTQSYPAAPGYYSVVFTSGMVDPGNNFGNWRYATKSGMKFEDMDADGVADAGELADHGLSGWTIFADLNGNGTLDAGEPSDVTDVNGDYSLSIKPREAAIIIREVPKAGWTQSYPAAPGYYSVVFTSGMVDPGNNFGNWRYATKSGMKFEDMDADGVADAGELADHGLSGWTIFADLNGNGTLDAGEPSDVTDVNGDYSLSIKPREAAIIIREVPKAGWTQSYPAAPGYYSVVFTSGMVDPGNNFGNWRYATKSGWFEDMDADGVADAGELADHGFHVPEWLNPGNNFGNWRYATKSGMKFQDLNGNQTNDAGEPPVADWTIYRYRVVGGHPTLTDNTLVLDGTMQTDATGHYIFTNMVPGVRYFIAEELPVSNWIQKYPYNGVPTAAYYPGHGWGYDITLVSGQVDANNDFGNVYYHDETAWAYDPATGKAHEFNDLASVTEEKWGWTNGPYSLASLVSPPGGGPGLTLELRAGVGQNDVDNKGELVGYVYVTFDPAAHTLKVKYCCTEGNTLTGIHLYVGTNMLMTDKKGNVTVSPGQFPYKWSGADTTCYEYTINLSNSNKTNWITNPNVIYIAAHAGVRMYEEYIPD